MGALGVHGVGGNGASLEGKRGEKRFKGRDLVRLPGDLPLGQDEAGKSQKGREEMDGLREVGGTSSKSLSIDGNGLGGVGCRKGPLGQYLLETLRIDLGQYRKNRRPGGRNVRLPGGGIEAAETGQKILFPGEMGGPFAQGLHVSAAGQDAGDDDLENDRRGWRTPLFLRGSGTAASRFHNPSIPSRGRASSDTDMRGPPVNEGCHRDERGSPGRLWTEGGPRRSWAPMVTIASGMVSISPRLSQTDPPGRLVASAGETGRIDEGLNHVQGMTVDPLPVGGEPPDRQGQSLRGQMNNPAGGKDQIADNVGQIGQAPGLLLRRPSDEGLPERAALPCPRRATHSPSRRATWRRDSPASHPKDR